MRHALTLLLAAILLVPPAQAQNKVRTETIEVAPVEEGEAGTAPGEAAGEAIEAPAEEAPAEEAEMPPEAVALPEVLYDPALLPPPVARTREHIIEAARTGDVEAMRPVFEANELPPVVSFGEETDPIAFWKSVSGDPDGREILAIMIEILEAGYVHLDAGTPQEMYVWPYFHALPLHSLTPPQEVELYKLITPHDRKGMEDFGAYIFYRLGIGPDGTWHFFVAGD